eukprot:CAMPEP_0170580998 /NCGR_PEP_ID=MMETSP0224-20130122/6806_1 /TAXON_ID=285029 /ORGANISM="Togula jolla, Strain CCCM 725" /LENGTH=144 /DNA_ID=CAMNT_0010904107 /DNA_START=215 /DNA_END=649 /DNA_ORIENTATION=+
MHLPSDEVSLEPSEESQAPAALRALKPWLVRRPCVEVEEGEPEHLVADQSRVDEFSLQSRQLPGGQRDADVLNVADGHHDLGAEELRATPKGAHEVMEVGLQDNHVHDGGRRSKKPHATEICLNGYRQRKIDGDDPVTGIEQAG